MPTDDFRPAAPGWQIVVTIPDRDELRAPLVGWSLTAPDRWVPSYFNKGRVMPLDQDNLEKATVTVVPDPGPVEEMSRHTAALRGFADAAEAHCYELRHINRG
jgi:hypothetical protein